MKNRLISLISAALMCVSAAMPVSAAPSYTAGAISAAAVPSYVTAAAPAATVSTPKLLPGYSYTKNTNNISWEKVSGADGYYVYRYADNCKIWLNVARVPASQNYLNDTGLPPGTRFQYRIKAYTTVSGKNNFSSYSNTINTATKPTTPIIFVCSGKTDSSISLTWSGVKGTGYEVERSSDGTNWVNVASLNGMNTNTYTNTGLSAGTKYYFRVRAVSKDDNGTKLYGDYTAVGAYKTTGKAVSTEELYENEVLRLINIERSKYGLSALKFNTTLNKLADKRAVQIKEEFSHSYRGQTAGDMLDEMGYYWLTWGENIAWGQRTPEQVVNDWMNSPGHRANILNGNFNQIGIGFNDYYWVQVFSN
ncbi:MAG: fibronectin type III domain-containing protein [Ruminococcus sp.]|nr:fibronectin type III domain-containing protein [Ruminococcus sp.]